MNSPQSFSRGNAFCSASKTLRPACDKRIAELEPAGPAPTIAMSYFWLKAVISFLARQNQSVCGRSPNTDVAQTGLSGKATQFGGFVAAEYRQRTVFAGKRLKHDAADGPIKIVRNGAAVQVDDVNASGGDSAHFAKQFDRQIVGQVMQEQRAVHKIETVVGERHQQSVALQSIDHAAFRTAIDRASGLGVEFGTDKERLTVAKPAANGPQQFTRSGTDVEYPDRAFDSGDVMQYQRPQGPHFTENAVDDTHFAMPFSVFLGRIVARVETLEPVASLFEAAEHQSAYL